MTFYFLKLCWKNIWRNKRRTFITVNAIGLGMMSIIAIYNLYDGFHEQIIQNVIRYHSGHLIVTAPAYTKQEAPNLYLKDPSRIETWLNQKPEVQAWSERVLVQGLISSANGSANILFTGIDPEREVKVTRFSTTLIKGKYFDPTVPKGIVIGKGISELLKVDVGSKVVALTQGVDGSVGNELFHVVGIFETDSEIDRSLAFIQSADARELLSLPAKATHEISILLKSDHDLYPVRDAFARAFSTADSTPHAKDGAEILTWMQVQKPVVAIIELDRSVNRLLMIIILFVAALGITNSILMSIMERVREFGVMMAMGTTKAEVIRMVVVETIMLGVVGGALGNLLGLVVTRYFHYAGFDLKWLTSQNLVIEGMVVQTVSHPVVHWHNSLMITVVILVLSALVSFIPARHISKLTAVEALRAH